MSQGNNLYRLKLQSYSDEKLRSTQFDSLSVRPTKEFGKDFGMVNFSGVTMEFVRCVTPLRVAVERVLLLMSWTSPFKTLGFLCAVSFLVYFADLIMILIGLLLWTKVKHSVLGYLISVELPSSSDNMVEDFKKNLAFIQMLETSWVELVTSVEDAFKGVERSKIKKAVSLLQLLPLLGILITFQFSKSSRAVYIIILWIFGILCHPLGMEILINSFQRVRARFQARLAVIRRKKLNDQGSEQSPPTQEGLLAQDRCYGVGPSVVPRITPEQSQSSNFSSVRASELSTQVAGPQFEAQTALDTVKTKLPEQISNQGNSNLVRDVVVFENQRWWVGVGFTAQFILNESHPWTDTWGKQSPHKDLIEPSFEGKKWRWNGDWTLIINETTDKQGWAYGTSFKAKELSPKNEFLDVIRRRKWVRKCQPDNSS